MARRAALTSSDCRKTRPHYLCDVFVLPKFLYSSTGGSALFKHVSGVHWQELDADMLKSINNYPQIFTAGLSLLIFSTASLMFVHRRLKRRQSRRHPQSDTGDVV
jgi:hypothetical protein